MGITERREREKAERRKAILNSARELILSQGVERVSMEDVARKAEISKATVYLYFSCKETLLNEICEEAAREFVGHFKAPLEAGLTGLEALRYFWRGYVELFGSSDEMIIVFKVRNFLNSWLPIVLQGDTGKSPNVNAIIEAITTIINKCKTEGIFRSDLDSAMATRLLLSMFSMCMENADRMPQEARRSPAIIEEMTKNFQVIIYGFASEGIDRSCLDFFN